jgi:hypothetical protein
MTMTDALWPVLAVIVLFSIGVGLEAAYHAIKKALK